jgi:hypothetical protein
MGGSDRRWLRERPFFGLLVNLSNKVWFGYCRDKIVERNDDNIFVAYAYGGRNFAKDSIIPMDRCYVIMIIEIGKDQLSSS